MGDFARFMYCSQRKVRGMLVSCACPRFGRNNSVAVARYVPLFRHEPMSEAANVCTEHVSRTSHGKCPVSPDWTEPLSTEHVPYQAFQPFLLTSSAKSEESLTSFKAGNGILDSTGISFIMSLQASRLHFMPAEQRQCPPTRNPARAPMSILPS